MYSVKNALLYGFLVWLIPFAAAVPFYSPEGEPAIDIFLFKTIMIIVGGITGAVFLVLYFRRVTVNPVREGIIIGCVWLAINWALDFAVLVPLNDMAMGTYFAEIGLRYLTLPTFSIAIGVLLSQTSNRS